MLHFCITFLNQDLGFSIYNRLESNRKKSRINICSLGHKSNRLTLDWIYLFIYLFIYALNRFSMLLNMAMLMCLVLADYSNCNNNNN